MDVQRFTQAARIRGLVDDLRGACEGKEFSDVIDDGGNQYVDIMMEGGGVLGVALVGYTYILEQVGLRFLRIGGTSAGSVNALLIAALGTPEQRKSERVVELLANLDIDRFVDADPDVRDMIRAFVQDAGRLEILRDVWQAREDLGEALEDLGLNPGVAFREWLSDVLRGEGIDSAWQLEQRMRAVPQNLRRRDGQEPVFKHDDFRLALIAADVSTETKVVFPKMAPLYWEDPDEVDPALFVRASMSIPFFFRPLRVDIPQGEAARKNWEDLANYKENLPTESTFVDGGIMSNFPIDLFHKPQEMPAAPTFGVKLRAAQRKRRIENLTQLTAAIFDSARRCMDYEFIERNPDYKNLVAYIDTGDHNWLNFEMRDEDKIDLFIRGAETAATFLKSFDWEKYNELRRRRAKAFADAL